MCEHSSLSLLGRIIIQNNENPSHTHSPFIGNPALLACRYHSPASECYLHRSGDKSQHFRANDHQYNSAAILQLRRRLTRLFLASNLHVLPIRPIPLKQHRNHHPNNNQQTCQHHPNPSLQQHPTHSLNNHLPASALPHHNHQQLPAPNPLSQLLRHPPTHHLSAGLLCYCFVLCLLQG